MEFSNTFNARRGKLLIRMASEFFGYGAFDKPYWFVGTEPGGDDPDELYSKLDSWERLGCAPVVCNRKHHLGAKITRHHKFGAKPQATWRPLLLTFMAYKGLYRDEVTALQWIKDQQIKSFGCDGGDSAVLELGGLPAKDQKHWTYDVFGQNSLHSREIYGATYIENRVRRLRAEATNARPRFVWMYGSRDLHMKYWRKIGGGEFSRDPDLDYDLREENGTLFVVTDHTTYHQKNAHWIALGKSIRARTDDLVGK